jgi:hypothetical protein
MAMASCSIVERFDVIGDVIGSGLAVLIDMLLDPFLLETAEERLGNRVAPAVSTTAHAGFKMVGFAKPPPDVAPVLHALIGMDQCTSRSAPPHSHR